MPSKTIYVSDEDMALYQQAQTLSGGNLSAAIVAALRRYVEVEQARQDGYDEVILPVGRSGGRKVRFSGVLLGEWGHTVEGRFERIRVYRTRGGKYAVHREQYAGDSWRAGNGPSGGWRSYLGYFGLGDQAWNYVQGEATLEVIDSLEELRTMLPEQFYDVISSASEEPAVEDLDI